MKRGEVECERTRQKIYNYIVLHIKVYGYPPTLRDIGDAVGIGSTSVVHHHIKKMISIGMLKTGHEGASRAIGVPGYEFVKKGNV